MLKTMTWAKWVKKIMQLLPIEKESQYIKDAILESFIGAVEKELPKTELYTQAGCILSQEFCESVNSEPVADLPPLNAVAKKAEVLLAAPVGKKPRAIKQQPKSIDKELCETYDETFHSAPQSPEVVAAQAAIDAIRAESLKAEQSLVCEPLDPAVIKAPAKKTKKKKSVVPVTSLADKASEMLSSDAEYDAFKSHMVEVIDGINKGNSNDK